MTQFDGVDCGSLHRGALSKASLISRGTEGANPSPSSAESVANLTDNATDSSLLGDEVRVLTRTDRFARAHSQCRC